ncbi:MAG: DUF2156 domain-containing protein [Clostridiales bacterium]|nr:DUF2156 domain-containing protein [Clostridiales bacterium]
MPKSCWGTRCACCADHEGEPEAHTDDCTLDFARVTLDRRDHLQQYLQHNQNPCCDLSFANLFAWGEVYETSYATSGDMLYLRVCRDGSCMFLPPIGTGDFGAAVVRLMREACSEGEPALRMLCVTERERCMLEEAHPGRFTFARMRDNDDYVHLTASLGQLQGKKYHGKRGHVKRFQKSYAHEYRRMTAQDVPALLELNRTWAEQTYGDSPDRDEILASTRLLENFEALELVGGLLLVDGQPVAASVGSRHHPGSDTLVVHYEKGLSQTYDGVYSALNHLFMQDCMADFRYANREEDMGILGLRKSKLSYHPECLVEKYMAVCRL